MKNQNIKNHPPLNPQLLLTSPNKPTPPSSLSQYNYPHNFKTAYGLKLVVQPILEGAERTKQSFKAECDINNIMAKYQRTGVLDFAAKREPQYGDCTGIEFQAGMEMISRARTMFEELPSSIRARFENNPVEFLNFVQNPENREEAKELGLLKPDAPQAPLLPAPPPKDAPAAPLNRQAVRKQAQETAARNAEEDKSDST